MFIASAFACNVQDLTLDIPNYGLRDVKLSAFSSTSIKKLKLNLLFTEFPETDIWDLPNLTTLHLILRILVPDYRVILPESCLTCLPSLRTLLLDGLQLPDSVSLPALTTLYLKNCSFPRNVGDFPALLTLTLDGVPFGDPNFFSSLVNLRNLILFIPKNINEYCFVICPQLASLEINAKISANTSRSGKIIVVASKIRNFSSVGFFPITFGVSELENVNIKLRDSTGNGIMPSLKELRRYGTQVIDMFSELSSARILTLDLETIEALSAVSKSLVRFPSPFYNLKYVKVPLGCKETSISTNLKRYLLGRSPEATIVTTLPQNGWQSSDFIEQLKIPRPLLDKLDAVDSRIDNAKSNLQDLHALRMRMLAENNIDIGTMGTSVDVGSIGDLFSGP